MNISPDIIAEAHSLLRNENTVLPVGIKIGLATPVFFVAEENDESVIAHTTIEHGGAIYKIGIKING